MTTGASCSGICVSGEEGREDDKQPQLACSSVHKEEHAGGLGGSDTKLLSHGSAGSMFPSVNDAKEPESPWLQCICVSSNELNE